MPRKSVETPSDRAQALAAAPVRNPEVAEARSAGGRLILVVPTRVRPWLRGAFALFGSEARSAPRKIELDQLGEEVWGLIDGKRSVAAIAAGLAASRKLEPREAELSVAAFMRELGRRGLVALREPEL